MQLDEVPKEIRQRMRTKWNCAIINGWTDSLWMGCALCSIVKDGCPTECPLYPDGWCVKYSRVSKLSVSYQDGGLFRHEAISAWQTRVKEFVKLIDASLARTSQAEVPTADTSALPAQAEDRG
jgi:hypothetical protein